MNRLMVLGWSWIDYWHLDGHESIIDTWMVMNRLLALGWSWIDYWYLLGHESTDGTWMVMNRLSTRRMPLNRLLALGRPYIIHSTQHNWNTIVFKMKTTGLTSLSMLSLMPFRYRNWISCIPWIQWHNSLASSVYVPSIMITNYSLTRHCHFRSKINNSWVTIFAFEQIWVIKCRKKEKEWWSSFKWESIECYSRQQSIFWITKNKV